MTLNSDKFNCKKCIFNNHCNESNPAPFYQWEIKEINFQSKTCLLPMIKRQSHEAIELYNMYKQGIMPFSGGYLEQPYKYIEMMKIIRAHLSNV